MDDDREHRELEERMMRYRVMEREVTDPLAIGLLHDIVTELEAALEQPKEKGQSAKARQSFRAAGRKRKY
jgi:hypothetical protein